MLKLGRESSTENKIEQRHRTEHTTQQAQSPKVTTRGENLAGVCQKCQTNVCKICFIIYE